MYISCKKGKHFSTINQIDTMSRTFVLIFGLLNKCDLRSIITEKQPEKCLNHHPFCYLKAYINQFNMTQLRTRNSKSEAPISSTLKKAIQKKSASNMKSIVQTFVAKDKDIKSKLVDRLKVIFIDVKSS